MYVLYTTQSRLRISAPFYLIFYRTYIHKWGCSCMFEYTSQPPTARIYIILFNFQIGNNFDVKIKKSANADFFILSCAGAAMWIGRLDITAG